VCPDGDGDNFAIGGPNGFLNSGFRGADWRGGDCDDSDATIYPGRATTSHPPSVDHNCNGIFGTSPQGVPYEELYCNGTQQRGVAILGDSAAAHFQLRVAAVSAAPALPPPPWASPFDPPTPPTHPTPPTPTLAPLADPADPTDPCVPPPPFAPPPPGLTHIVSSAHA
jgi:hypothetical protein